MFTKDDWKEVSEEVTKYKVGAPTRVDLVAPIDEVVPPGNTGLGPSQTSCFQVLNISTKIKKEIITPMELFKKVEKVDSSEAALLAKLGISSFSYGFVVLSGYDDGSVFNPKMPNLTEDDLTKKFASGVSMLTAPSLANSSTTNPTKAVVVAAAGYMERGGLAHRNGSMAAPLRHQKIGNKIVLRFSSSMASDKQSYAHVHKVTTLTCEENKRGIKLAMHVKPSENRFVHLSSCNTPLVCIEP